MTKPDLKLIEGGKVEELPEQVEFPCPSCKRSCLMFPRTKPIAVQHALPTCRSWKLIEGKKDDIERFLIKAGVHLLLPQAKR